MSQNPEYRLSNIDKEQCKNLTFEQLVESVGKLMYPAHRLDNSKIYIPLKETEPMSDELFTQLFHSPWVRFVGDSMAILRFQTRCKKLGLINSNE